MQSQSVSRRVHKNLKQTKHKHASEDREYIRRSCFFFALLFILAGITGVVYVGSVIAKYATNLPPTDTPLSRSLPESTLVYDKNGNIIYTIYSSENRIYVPLSKIPKVMQMAMLSAEDIHFYSEDGIDPLAIARSAVFDIFAKSQDETLQGASTITQQLVKYTSLTQSRTVERKVKEIILTLKVTQAYSKDQILQAYLNTVPFGGNNYGIEAASQAYFNKDVWNLDLAESAFLAGLPQAPGVYSPLYSSDPAALQFALSRQHYVLAQMLKYKNITGVTSAEIQSALSEKLVFASPEYLKYPDFDLYIRGLLDQMYGTNMVNNGGLRVYTTLDPTLEADAEATVQKDVPKLVAEGLNAHNASLIAEDTTNGNLLAMVGSVNYNDPSPEVEGNVNMTLFPVSPGSSVKPWVYMTAFEQGQNPDSIVNDVKTTFTGDYTPEDFDFKYMGNISIKTALLNSRNIPAVETAMKVGLVNVYNNITAGGLISIPPAFASYPSLAIGSCYIPLIQETAGYQVFSQDGVMHPMRSILLVQNKYGQTIYNNQAVLSTQLFPTTPVKELNSILQGYSTLAPVKARGYTVAGKTGTSQDAKNNIFMGYSSHLATGVWSGNTNQTATSANTFGEDTAALLWNDFMLKALPLYPGNSAF